MIKYSIVDMIMDYEEGRLSKDEVDELFQHLLDTRLLFGLQGHYQRTAKELIDAGRIKVKRETG